VAVKWFNFRLAINTCHQAQRRRSKTDRFRNLGPGNEGSFAFGLNAEPEKRNNYMIVP
jgi:hypothetical protein